MAEILQQSFNSSVVTRMAASILVVDDEPQITRLLDRYLSREGFSITTAASGSEMKARMAQGRFDVVLLDLMMPGEDGLALVRNLRESFNPGIIVVTGKSDPVDRVVGLEMGADDYVLKPFELREVLARVRSLLRRMHDEPKAARGAEICEFGQWVLDKRSRQLRSLVGGRIYVTPGEYNLLCALVDNIDRAVDRDQLSRLSFGRPYNPFDRSIDVLIGRLRRKLEPDVHNPTLIKTIRGAGYMLAGQGMAEA